MRVRRLLFAALFALPATANAQTAVPAGVSRAQAFSRSDAAVIPLSPAPLRNGAIAATSDETPRWLKWGIVGAVAGAVLYTAIRAGDTHPGSVIGNAAAGAITGFIVVGGGVALYDWACGSRRSGGCG